MADSEDRSDHPTIKASAGYDRTTSWYLDASARAPVQDPLIGTCIGGDGKYKILEVAGEGGMSHVYKAEQKPIDRIVAVKTLKLQLLADANLFKRFQREVKTLSQLNHPNIVTAYDCFLAPTDKSTS